MPDGSPYPILVRDIIPRKEVVRHLAVNFHADVPRVDAPYNDNTSETDVPPWCYKWTDGRTGWYLGGVKYRAHGANKIQIKTSNDDVSGKR